MYVLAETYFKTAFKGYDTQQVDEFIVALSDKYDQNIEDMAEKVRSLSAENTRLKLELSEARAFAEENAKSHEAALEEKQKEYDALCAEIGEMMVVADKRASEIINNAEKEANLVIDLARRNGENEAKVIRLAAEEEAAKMIEDTRRKCESLSAAAEEFRQRQDEMKRSMTETEKRFGDALNKLREGISGQEN